MNRYRQSAFILALSGRDHVSVEEKLKCMEAFISRGYDVNQKFLSKLEKQTVPAITRVSLLYN